MGLSAPAAGCRQKIVWTNLRVPEMTVGGVNYSSKIYGDSLDESNFLVRGTKKRRDKNMLEALERRIPVLVTMTRDGKPRLPRVIGVGMVESVRNVPEGLREFRIRFRHTVSESRQDNRVLVRHDKDSKRCWIKRAFLEHIGLSYSGNIMQCSVMCYLDGKRAATADEVQPPESASEAA
jgi:hypothetical protein